MPPYDPAPKTTHKEFLGVPGAIGITFSVTYFAYFFDLGCSARGCPPLPFDQFIINGLRGYASSLQPWKALYDPRALQVYLAYYAFCVLCWLVLPGKLEKGLPLRNGEVLTYKRNAFATILVITSLLIGLLSTKGPQPMVFIYDHWTGLVTASVLVSYTLSFYVYAASFLPGKMLAEGGNSDSAIYNWFIGRELNPRIGSFDIKTFNELRPGLIGWFLFDVGFACKQYVELGRLTDSMVLVVFFQAFYVFDSLWNEDAVFSTMDVVTDGFGWMLAAGDLLWVPYTYSLQARYLATHPKDLGLYGTVGVLAVQAVGYYIFRVSNLEKNDFRNGKNPKNLTYMPTERGTNLLTSGWWGWSRHPNYLGDWIMAWAWCLPTGFSTPLTYFYVVYFAILLLHRQQRDDAHCKKKYGKDWDKYCKLVKYRIIPGIY